ncbi:MAG: PA2779 family protein [Rhizobacter sp.]
MTRPRRLMAAFVAGCLSFAGFVQAAQAGGLITTEQVAVSEGLRTAADQRTRLLTVLDRADVSAALVERGVSLDQARARIAALTDAEVTRIGGEIDKAPAGASELLGTLVIIGAVLLITDILGYTHIFPFIKPMR